jgi:SAM-dependent methyltransferase
MNPDPFAAARHYDSWYTRYPQAFASELAALRALLPPFERGLEIGVGSGRFAQALGVREGLEPSAPMAELARSRGIQVFVGQAEALPFGDQQYDLILMLTVLCFVQDPLRGLQEALRVSQPQGRLLLATLDPEVPWVALARQRGQTLRRANLPTISALQEALHNTGWHCEAMVQTLVQAPETLTEPEPPRPGHGQGGYVVLLLSRFC